MLLTAVARVRKHYEGYRRNGVSASGLAVLNICSSHFTYPPRLPLLFALNSGASMAIAPHDRSLSSHVLRVPCRITERKLHHSPVFGGKRTIFLLKPLTAAAFLLPRSLRNDQKALFRGHIARRFAAWCASHFHAARHIQAGVRGFMARCHAQEMRIARVWTLSGLPALIRLQKVVRGFIVRKAFARRMEESIRVRIVVPAAGVLQKCWRGKKGRDEGARRVRMRAAATEIQVHRSALLLRVSLKVINTDSCTLACHGEADVG